MNVTVVEWLLCDKHCARHDTSLTTHRKLYQVGINYSYFTNGKSEAEKAYVVSQKSSVIVRAQLVLKPRAACVLSI